MNDLTKSTMSQSLHPLQAQTLITIHLLFNLHLLYYFYLVFKPLRISQLLLFLHPMFICTDVHITNFLSIFCVWNASHSCAWFSSSCSTYFFWGPYLGSIIPSHFHENALAFSLILQS